MGKQSQFNYKCICCLVNILSRQEFGRIGNPALRLVFVDINEEKRILTDVTDLSQQKVTGTDRARALPSHSLCPNPVYDSRPCVSCLEIQVKTY